MLTSTPTIYGPLLVAMFSLSSSVFRSLVILICQAEMSLFHICIHLGSLVYRANSQVKILYFNAEETCYASSAFKILAVHKC